MAGSTKTLESIPGVGPVFTIVIIAEIGQIEKFDDETKSPNTLDYTGESNNPVVLRLKGT